MRELFFIGYGFCMAFVTYCALRQGLILFKSRNLDLNGTRSTQWTFLVFNVCFATFIGLRLLELADMWMVWIEPLRLFLIAIMSSVGLIFYAGGK